MENLETQEISPHVWHQELRIITQISELSIALLISQYQIETLSKLVFSKSALFSANRQSGFVFQVALLIEEVPETTVDFESMNSLLCCRPPGS